nr:hypothetical protein GCM10025699_20140 [Microbacterium flavescens]
MADQFHPVDRLLHRHPFRLELLRADDDGRVALLLFIAGDDRDLAGRDGAEHVGRCRLHIDPLDGAAALVEFGAPRVVAGVHALVLRASQLLAQLVDREIERSELVTVSGLGPDDRALSGERQFDGVVLHASVVIRAVSDLDVHALSARSEVFDAGDLVFDDRAKAICHSHSHADDAGFHP